MARAETVEERLRLLDHLIVTSSQLVAGVKRYTENIDEQFGGLIMEPMSAVESVLADAPAVGTLFDGELRDEDLEVTYFRAPMQPSTEEGKGVKVRHKLTGKTVESYTGRNRVDNLESAKATIKRFLEQDMEDLRR